MQCARKASAETGDEKLSDGETETTEKVKKKKKRTFDKVLDLGSKRAEIGERLRFHGEKCVSHGGEQFK